MAIHTDIAACIFGIIASILLFVVSGLFYEFNGLTGCFVFLGVFFLLYTLFAFLIPNTKNSRDFVFSYGVSTGCMFVACLMTFIIMSHFHTRPHCNVGTKSCAKYIFGSLFGFLSSGFFLVASILSFKVVHIW
ncbi:conserved Plasmodium protein, unknown function [Plasmodium relictum]|uniref:MARVEL domain-containing protein n=1 Tax=Plasmodium relictum TaxID=85471 RepID=A0A1J1H4U7_PLARL|nr:conserved Plasmodium protein, unknown function [Plasmodium relictum]CRG99935.1 conserved Plasmodium protein, unknown function [Plasmodium relictum]